MLAKPQGFPRKLGGCAGLDPRLRSAVSAGVGDGERGLRRGLRAPGVGVRPKWVLEYSPSNKRIRYFVSITYVRTGLWTAHKFCGGGKVLILQAVFGRCCQRKTCLSWEEASCKCLQMKNPFRYFKTSPEFIRLAVIRLPQLSRRASPNTCPTGASSESRSSWPTTKAPAPRPFTTDARPNQPRRCGKNFTLITPGYIQGS